MSRGKTGPGVLWIPLDAVAALSEQQLHVQCVRGLRAIGRLLAQRLFAVTGVCVLYWRRGVVEWTLKHHMALLDAQATIAELRKTLALERGQGLKAVQAEAENSDGEHSSVKWLENSDGEHSSVKWLEKSIQELTRQNEAEKALLVEKHRLALVSQ